MVISLLINNLIIYLYFRFINSIMLFIKIINLSNSINYLLFKTFYPLEFISQFLLIKLNIKFIIFLKVKKIKIIILNN